MQIWITRRERSQSRIKGRRCTVESLAEVKLKQQNQQQGELRKMVANKSFSTFVLIAILSSVSSYYVQPRVSHTPDAIVVDFAGLGFAPFPLGRGYSQIADPGYIPLNPYPMAPYQPMFYNGLPFLRQAAPATCGRGATATPATRSLISDRVVGATGSALTPANPATQATAAKKNTWTFLVAVSFVGNVTCAGTLLSPTKVLTAASCFEKMSMYQMSTATVSIGAYTSDQSDAQMTRRVSQVVINSQYNSLTFANDIAILTLDMPVVFSKSVGSVCLPPANADPDAYAGQNAVIIGWGQVPASSGGGGTPNSGRRKRQAASTPVPLQQALVAVAYNTDCRNDAAVNKFMSSTTSCLTSFDGSTLARFTCPSDVGGPVLVNSAPNVQGTNAVWTQVGINSYTAAGCATNGLKTNVAAFISWIATYNV